MRSAPATSTDTLSVTFFEESSFVRIAVAASPLPHLADPVSFARFACSAAGILRMTSCSRSVAINARPHVRCCRYAGRARWPPDCAQNSSSRLSRRRHHCLMLVGYRRDRQEDDIASLRPSLLEVESAQTGSCRSNTATRRFGRSGRIPARARFHPIDRISRSVPAAEGRRPQSR